jgi:citrate synthase
MAGATPTPTRGAQGSGLHLFLSMPAPFSPGLEGVVAAQTEISEVDGLNGRLIYRGGYLIHELAERSFEEIAYLLWHGNLPDEGQLEELKQQMASNRSLNGQARAALAGLNRDVDPMDALRTVLSAQGAAPDCPKPTLEGAIEITAVTPSAVAGYYRHQQGQELVDPRADLGHAANFLYMMWGEEPDPDRVRYLEAYLVLLADHGLNASTFTARVAASTGTDLYSAMIAAIGALKGPSHGGAATGAMKMLDKIGSAENAEAWLTEAMTRKERIAGFGHRVYRTYDPRAKILKKLAEEGNPRFYRVASRTEELALRMLKERHPERPNATNVDYYSAGILQAAGFPKEFFTCVFAASRMAGWTAHVLEYMAQDGRIIRPASEWIGPDPDKRTAASA